MSEEGRGDGGREQPHRFSPDEGTTAPSTPAMRELLRGLPVFAGDPPAFNVTGTPSNPYALFTTWLNEAIEAGAPEPHVMTLSTTDGEGRPDARMLILKDLTRMGFWFATSADSAKGRQLKANPAAALTFYWPILGRQVRIRGQVKAAPAEQSARDFLARSVGARAVALASQESAALTSRAECAAAVDAARARLASTPLLVATMWTLCVVKPDDIEFWQADRDRQHCRLRYTAAKDRWDRSLLWP